MASYKHIFIQDNVSSEEYKTKGIPVPQKPFPIRERELHQIELDKSNYLF